MPNALQPGFHRDLILASPQRASLDAFVNPGSPQASGLHTLLTECWEGEADADRLPIQYLGYRVVNLPHQQPDDDFCARQRTYQCWLKLRLSVAGVPQEYPLAHLPWMTARDTFVIKGHEIVPIAQLLPAPGVLFTRRTRPGGRIGVAYMADIRPRRGHTLRLRCWRRAADTPTALQATVQVGQAGRWDIRQFLTGLFGQTSLACHRLQALLERYFQEPKTPPAQASPTFATLRHRLLHTNMSGGFDWSVAGREQLNARLAPVFQEWGLSPSADRALTLEDVHAVLAYLVALTTGKAAWARLDDPEHLANKRLRLVGDVLADTMWWEFTRTRETLNLALQGDGKPGVSLDLLSSAVDKALEELFKPGALFQILDDTNPLAAVSHKRTVTLRGPGGVHSKFGSLEKRDVHPSHYGRLCPCETPESEDMGLTLHLAAYAQVKDGQLITPVRTASGDLTYLTPEQENARSLCTPSELLPARRRAGLVLTRRYAFSGTPETPVYGEAAYVPESDIAFYGVSLEQQLGLAACLMPFLSHSDANRVLMGAKNLKQALPLLKPEIPLVRTGMEDIVAALSGETPAARGAGRTAIVDGTLALGTNLLVAYMPWRGYNFEDAIVASDRLVREDLLTTVHVTEVAYDMPPSERVIDQHHAPRHLDLFGVIKPGTRVRAGDVLLRTARLVAERRDLTSAAIERLRTRGQVYAEDATVYEITSHDYVARLGEEGEVVEVKSIRNALGQVQRVLIRLKCVCPLRVGDKLMGRHGNKGVVSSIVPVEQMPTLPDGTPVDLILNPHGVVSRMNLGQLYETHLGWVLRHRQNLPPAQQGSVPEVLTPFQTVAREDLSHWLVQTGLDAQGKARLRDGRHGLEFDQPVVVGYQYIVKLNHRPEDKLAVRQVGRYTALTKQPVQGRRQGGGQRVGEMETWALQVHQAPRLLEEFFTAKADDLQRRFEMQQWLAAMPGESHARLSPASLPEALRVALVFLQGIGIVAVPTGEQDHESLLPFPSTVRSDRLGNMRWRFVQETDLQVWDQRTSAASAEVHSPATFAWAEYSTLACCESSGFAEQLTTHRPGSRERVCRRCGKKASICRRVYRWRPIPGGLYEPSIFGTPPSLGHTWDSRSDRVSREKAWREHFGYIKLCAPVKNPLTGQEMTFLPIVPAALRFRYDPEDPAWQRLDRLSPTSLDGLYARVITMNNALRQPAATPYTRDDLEQAIQRLLSGDNNHDEVECLARFLKGKRGLFRQAVLGKRADYSGRAVIVPDPALALDTCRLPYRMGVELLRPWLKQGLQARGCTPQTIEAILTHPAESKHRRALDEVLPEALQLGAQARVCILNRAPSLHKFNLLAFTFSLWDEDVIALPPLVCAGYNADFDGDTMAVHLPLTIASQHEARQRLSPSANLYSPAHGQLILHLAQDIVAGLAYKTLRQTGGLPKHFATAIRQQASTAPDVVEQTQALMREGFAWATQGGLSFGVFDIPSLPNRQELLQDLLADQGLAAFYDGTLDGEEREHVADQWKNKVLHTMQQCLRTGLTPHALNALALMVLSGARGNIATVVQLGGMRGLLEKGSTGYLEYPIESNFVEGLSPLEFFLSTHGSRASMVDKKLNVALAGDLTRRLVNCAYNLRITQYDCGTTGERSALTCAAPAGLCQVCYGPEYDTAALPPLGSPVGLLAATSIGERGTQLSLRAFHTGGAKGDNIARGLPHINALFENRWVEISHDRWERYRAQAAARGGHLPDRESLGQCVSLRLGNVAQTPVDVLDIVLGEVYENYQRDELPPRLFEVILRAMIRWDGGRMHLRGLTAAARANLYPLERVAFRDAIRQARRNAAEGIEQEIQGAQERVMIAHFS